MLTNISKKEWAWVTAWSAAIMLLTSLPYVYGWWLSTSQLQFSGHILGVEDANSYIAKMRLGAAGNWLFYLVYTPEPHDGAFLFTFHLLLGKIAGLTQLNLILVYHLARLIFGFGLLLTLYVFIGYFINNISQRRLAFLLTATGGGLGWLLVLVAPGLGLPLDWYVPEGFTFLVLFHLPHLALAELLLLWAFLFTLHSWANRTWPPVIWAGLALLGMALITAFYLGVYVAVLGVTWLVITVTGSSWRNTWPMLAKFSIAASMALPVVLYDAYIFTSNPIFKGWSQQNTILSPEPWHYVFAYGLLIIPAWLGGAYLWRSTELVRPHRLFLPIWCLIFPVLVYLPFNLQRRMVVGVQIALIILATYGLTRLTRRLYPTKKRQLFTGVVILLSLTNIFMVMGSLAPLSTRRTPLFISASQLEAMTWLDQHAQGQVIMGSYESGNLLPAYATVRVFVGHGPETIHSDEKRKLVKTFFDRATTDKWRRELLQKYQVHYLYYGPTERANGDFSPGQASYLKLTYENESVQIFKVILP